MRALKCDKKSDRQLVKQTLKNADYFECLVGRYEEKLMRYIRRITNVDNETAEDILQEVFIKIYKNLNDYDPEFTFNSWVYRIAHNETISFYRKQKVRPETVQLESDEGVDYLNMIPDDISLRDDYVKKELASQVKKVISHMTDKYKSVLILRYMEDKSYEEISDILQKPSGTVATLINRAKSEFKKLAQKYHITN